MRDDEREAIERLLDRHLETQRSRDRWLLVANLVAVVLGIVICIAIIWLVRR